MSSPDSVTARVLDRLVAFSYRRPFVVLALFLVVGGAAGWVSSTLPFKGDFIELLPQGSQEVKDLRFVEAKAGGGGYLVVQIKGGDRGQRRALGAKLTERLEKRTDLIRFVEYRFDIDFFQKRGLLLLPPEKLEALEKDVGARIDYERKHANPLVVDLLDEEPPTPFDQLAKKYGSDAPQTEYVESQDGSELYLHVKPTGLPADLDYNRKLVRAAREDADAVLPGFPGVQVNFTGAYVIRIEEDETMQADLQRAAGLAMGIALGIILLATRRLSALLVVTGPVLLGVAVTFAFAKFNVGHLNPVTGFLGAILIGLGIEYGVHLAMRYWEERRALEPLPAMQAAVKGTFTGALTSAATNAAAFLVLVLAEFRAFQQFGRIAAFGVMATVIAAYLLAPAVLLIAEKIRPFRRGDAPSDLGDGPVVKGKPLPLPALLGIMGAVIAFAAFSVSVAPKAAFESDLRKLKGESPATDLDEHITQQLGISMTPALLYAESLEQAKQVTQVVEAVKKESGDRTAFQKVLSLNDVLPQDVERSKPALERLRKHLTDVPDSLKEGDSGARLKQFLEMIDAKPWGVDEVPLEIRRRFSALDGGGTFVLVFPRYNGYDTNNLKLWAGDLDAVVARAKSQGLTVPVLDGNRIASRILTLVRQDGPFVLGAAAVVVFLMIWLSLRSLKEAVLVAGPLFLGMTGLFGGMYLTGVKLNFLNVVVLPNLLTIAVDNSVHLFHRYKEEGRGSLAHVVRHTGFAAVVATLSNAAGYGAMLVAHHVGLRSIAWLALLGVTSTFIGTTIFFPTLLAALERWRRPADAPSQSTAAP